jgi:hypothetical protein
MFSICIVVLYLSYTFSQKQKNSGFYMISFIFFCSNEGDCSAVHSFESSNIMGVPATPPNKRDTVTDNEAQQQHQQQEIAITAKSFVEGESRLHLGTTSVGRGQMQWEQQNDKMNGRSLQQLSSTAMATVSIIHVSHNLFRLCTQILINVHSRRLRVR